MVRHEGHRLEIDRYQGDLDPLLIGEDEFSSVEESERFEKPEYFGAVVPVEKVLKMICDPDLAHCVQRLALRLE